jgi:hypothetical protein
MGSPRRGSSRSVLDATGGEVAAFAAAALILLAAVGGFLAA